MRRRMSQLEIDNNKASGVVTQEDVNAHHPLNDAGQEYDRRDHDASEEMSSYSIKFNFITMSFLFSINHGAVVTCIALATARLGNLGAWQNGILYFCYTGSALLGLATYITKDLLGPRNALVAGMLLYCIYVLCFGVAATIIQSYENDNDTNSSSAIIVKCSKALALFGAAAGGTGAGFLWTAQGSYFTLAAQEYSRAKAREDSDDLYNTERATASFSSIFAFWYLSLELAMRSLPSLLIQLFAVTWYGIFVALSLLTVASVIGMVHVKEYKSHRDAGSDTDPNAEAEPLPSLIDMKKISSTVHILINDPKMKYMIGLNASFGFAAAFLNAYVNGEAVRVVLNDEKGEYVGYLTAWLSAVAAIMSLVWGKFAERYTVHGKSIVLIIGALCFANVALPFLIKPTLTNWNGWWLLLFVYTCHGVGRATFEGTLKAVFADFFAYEKEGAFANIILQNGLASTIGYILSYSLYCNEPSRYCVYFADKSLHNVLFFECLVVVTSVLAIFGYLRASHIHRVSRSLGEYESLSEVPSIT